MKRANGGKGMSDEEVVAFVDRYMPVYEEQSGPVSPNTSYTGIYRSTKATTSSSDIPLPPLAWGQGYVG
jgi:pantothenate kinase-related protein Tda10